MSTEVKSQNMERIMLDGFRGGSVLANGVSIEIAKTDFEYMWNCFRKHRSAITKQSELELFLRKGDTATFGTISLRRDRRAGKIGYYLNVGGNPISFQTGQNTYGYAAVEPQVIQFFKDLFRAVRSEVQEFSVPVRLRAQIESLDIHIYSMSFAAYTEPMPTNHKNLARMIACWRAVLNTYTTTESGDRITLATELGLQWLDREEFPTSLGLAVKSGRNNSMKLVVYDKQEQIEEPVADLQSRARLDLTLTNFFFRNLMHIRPNLKDLSTYLRKNQLTWHSFIEQVLWNAVNRTCLTYMFTVPNVFHTEWNWNGQREVGPVWLKGGWKALPKADRKPFRRWCADRGINPMISPLAHLLMIMGRAHLDVTEDVMRRAAEGSEEGIRVYSNRLRNAINDSRDARAMRRILQKFNIDHSQLNVPLNNKTLP